MFVPRKKAIKCRDSILIKNNEVISSNDGHNCIPLQDYELTIEIRLNDLKARLYYSNVIQDRFLLWKMSTLNDNIPVS